MVFNPSNWRWSGCRRFYGCAVGVVLCLGLLLRLANLGSVQHFQGDQGRDYLEVMRWIQDGRWPLVGPQRITGDYTVGPGWYYTLAPALALSRFHPAAGAATMAVLGMLAAWLAGEWVRRATRSRLAALVVTTLYSISALGVYADRTLWNPHPLPLGVVAMACLIQGVRKRRTAVAAALIVLLAILPQWHTTGLLVDLAALPALVLAFWRARQGLRISRAGGSGRHIIIGAIAAGSILLLYVPPLLYELEPGHPGNLGHFFSRTLIPGAPSGAAAGESALLAFNRLALEVFRHTFDYPAIFQSPALLQAVLFGLRGLTLALAVMLVRRAWRRRLEPSTFFLVLLVAGYGGLLLLKGAAVQEYFMTALYPAPLLLAGWLMGGLLRDARGALPRRLPQQCAGLTLVFASLALGLGQFPRAWMIHQEAGLRRKDDLAQQRRVAEWIVHDSAGRPYSLQLAGFANTSAHYLYLVRWLGRAALNTDYQSHAVPRAELGELLYVIDEVDPEGVNPLVAQGVAERAAEFRGSTVYRIPSGKLTPATAAVGLTYGNRGPWALLMDDGGKR